MGENVRVKQAYLKQLPPQLHHITWAQPPTKETVLHSLQQMKQVITDMLPPKLAASMWDTSTSLSLEKLKHIANHLSTAKKPLAILETGSNDFHLFRKSHLKLFERDKLMIEKREIIDSLHKTLSLFQYLYQQRLPQAGMARFPQVTPDFLHNNPVIHKASRYPILHREKIHNKLRDDVSRGIYRVPKPGEKVQNLTRLNVVITEKYRLVHDLVMVNLGMVKQVYPLPTTEESFDFILDKRFRFIIDAVSSFHQFKLNSSIAGRFAVTTSLHKVLIPNVLVMGMKGSSEYAQQFHDIMLEPASDHIKAFMDDFHAGAETLEEAINLLIIFHILLLRHNVFIKPSKMQVLQKETVFLGKMLKGIKLYIPPECVDKIRNGEVKSISDLKGFIGFITYFAHHIPRWSQIRAPMDEIISAAVREGKSNSTLIPEEVKRAVEQAKEMFLKHHGLQAFRKEDQLIIDFDFSKKAIAIAIFQIPSSRLTALLQKKQLPKEERIIAFYSKKVPEHITKQGPSSTKGEAFAYQQALRKAHQYLVQSPYPPVVRSDSRGLILMMKSTDMVDSYFQGIRTRSQIHKPIFIHQSSEEQVVTDYLSRMRVSETPSPEEKRVHLHHISAEPVIEAEGKAPSPPPSAPPKLISFLNDIDWKHHYVNSKWKDTYLRLMTTADQSGPIKLQGLLLTDQQGRILTPPSILPTIFNHYHSDSLGASHAGATKLHAIISKQFQVPHLMDELLKLTAKCQLCQKTNPGKSSILRESTLREGMIPMSTISLDTVQFQKDLSHLGEGILIGACVLTKFVIFILLPDFKTTTIIEAITNHIIAVHGPPKQIVVDAATYFKSKEFEDFARPFEITISVALPRAHSTNPVERRIRDCRKVFRILNLKNPERGSISKSDLLLLAYGLNSQIHPRHGLSSYELVFGRNPHSIFQTNPIPIDSSSNQLESYLTRYIKWIHGDLKIQREVTQNQLADHILDLKMARQLQKTKPIPNLTKDAWIFIRNFTQLRNAPRFKGPFRVIATEGNAVYLYMTAIVSRETKPAPLVLSKHDFIVVISESNVLKIGRVIHTEGPKGQTVIIHAWHRTEKNPLEGPYKPAYIDSRDNTVVLTSRAVRNKPLKPITQQCSRENIWAVNCIKSTYARSYTIGKDLSTFIRWKKGDMPSIPHIPNYPIQR